VEPAESAQIRVELTRDSNRLELRYYGSDDFVVPQWWVGESDAAGELTRTDVLSGNGRTPADLTRWLSVIVGERNAGELVRRAVQASSPTGARIAS